MTFDIRLAICLAAFAAPSGLLPAEASGGVDSLRYEMDFRQTFSGGENTPFWLVNNLQGLGSPYKGAGYVTAGIYRDMDESRRFSWGAGAELAGSWCSPAPFRIQQLYGEMKYRCLDLMVGSKEMWSSYNNPLLSSGDMLYSGNSMPIPQVRAGIFDFAPVWGTKGWFSVKGYIAYGMFTDQRWQRAWVDPKLKRTEDVLFHSKGLWIKGGNEEKFPLTAEIGIEMASQFGGKSILDGHVIKADHSLKAFWHALFPTYAPNELHNELTTSIDGNMVGCYDIVIGWKPKADWGIRGYYEHYFEDQSQMTFEYGWKDGLWGIEATLPENPFVSTVVVEYLYTRDQTGAILHNSDEKVPEQVSGRDNYYSNAFYAGWSNWGMTIGNPLLLSPLYNRDHRLVTKTSRVQAWHMGLQGNPTEEIDWRMLVSYSRNWGTYQRPLPNVLGNFNFLAEVGWKPSKFKGWKGTLGIAADGGKLLGNSFGMAVSVSKTGSFGLGGNKKEKR